MLTPEGGQPEECGLSDHKGGRSRACPAEIAYSASPTLRGSPTGIMKRTPQPTLTQSKLTSLLQVTQKPSGEATAPGGARGIVDLETVEMDTSNQLGAPSDPAQAPPAPAASTTDFLLKAMKQNTDEIIKSFNASISSLAGKIEESSVRISDNSHAIKRHEVTTAECKGGLDRLEARVRALENGSGSNHASHVRAELSEAYLRARRSIRLWPVKGVTEEDLWGETGEFLHCLMGIAEGDVGQDDIEGIWRVEDPVGAGPVHDEVVVTFRDRVKRDLVMAGSVNLAGEVGPDKRPTAGTRLEIPPELKSTFRLLTRFGTRLRARHGEGTKRHIRFDDYGGSLVASVKLLGDENWTRVTPQMAKKDLEASMREEDSRNQARLAAKLVPGPRERLALPQPIARPGVRSRQVAMSSAVPSGKRPRWSGPADKTSLG